MAFVLHFAAARWEAIISETGPVDGIKKISLISKLMVRNSDIMHIDDLSTLQSEKCTRSSNSSKNVKVT